MASALIKASKRIEDMMSSVEYGSKQMVIFRNDQGMALIHVPSTSKRGLFSPVRPSFSETREQIETKSLNENYAQNLIIALGLWDIGRKITSGDEWLELGSRELESYLRDRNDLEIMGLNQLKNELIEEIKKSLMVGLCLNNLPKKIEIDEDLFKDFGASSVYLRLIKGLFHSFEECTNSGISLLNVYLDENYQVLVSKPKDERWQVILEDYLNIASELVLREQAPSIPKTIIKVVAE